MLLELCGFVVFLLFGLLGSHSFFHVFTPDPELQQMAGDYLRIVTVFSFGLFLSISFERMMQATGNTMLSMTTQLTGAVINIILDPIMIFGLLGTPQMGVAGAAAATVIGPDRRPAAGLCAQPAEEPRAQGGLAWVPA